MGAVRCSGEWSDQYSNIICIVTDSAIRPGPQWNAISAHSSLFLSQLLLNIDKDSIIWDWFSAVDTHRDYWKHSSTSVLNLWSPSDHSIKNPRLFEGNRLISFEDEWREIREHRAEKKEITRKEECVGTVRIVILLPTERINRRKCVYITHWFAPWNSSFSLSFSFPFFALRDTAITMWVLPIIFFRSVLPNYRWKGND